MGIFNSNSSNNLPVYVPSNISNPYYVANVYTNNAFIETNFSNISNLFDERIKDFKLDYNKKFITNVIKFFQVDYGTGEEILAMFNSNDKSNEILGINMLLGSVKEKIKEEIIKEIFK